MSTTNDGGPAFPTSSTDARHFLPDGSRIEVECDGQRVGMSLRDYFAGQVVGFVWAESEKWNDDRMKAGSSTRITPKNIALTCYEIADVMLAAREGGSK